MTKTAETNCRMPVEIAVSETCSKRRANVDHTGQFKVSGMACTNCALAIEKTLNGVPGVNIASVNFANETVTVDYDPRKIDLSRIFDHVREAGYIPLERGHDAEEDRSSVRRRNWLIFSEFVAA